MPDTPESKEKRLQTLETRLVEFVYSLDVRNTDLVAVVLIRLAGWASLFFVLCCLGMGLSRMLTGVFEFCGFQLMPNEANIVSGWDVGFVKRDEKMAISSIMSGLEFFLLAALPYLLLRTLGNYAASHIPTREKSSPACQDAKKETAAAESCNATMHHASKEDCKTDSEDHEKRNGKALTALMSVKALTTALLIAVVSTHLVAELLQGQKETNHTSGEAESIFEYQKLLMGCVLLLVLIIYFYVQESFCHQRIHSDSDRGVIAPENKNEGHS